MQAVFPRRRVRFPVPLSHRTVLSFWRLRPVREAERIVICQCCFDGVHGLRPMAYSPQPSSLVSLRHTIIARGISRAARAKPTAFSPLSSRLRFRSGHSHMIWIVRPRMHPRLKRRQHLSEAPGFCKTRRSGLSVSQRPLYATWRRLGFVLEAFGWPRTRSRSPGQASSQNLKKLQKQKKLKKKNTKN